MLAQGPRSRSENDSRSCISVAQFASINIDIMNSCYVFYSLRIIETVAFLFASYQVKALVEKLDVFLPRTYDNDPEEKNRRRACAASCSKEESRKQEDR